jgi:predicted TIM-barrel fold metal-dependent hydrolase
MVAGMRPEGWDCHVHVFDANEPVRPGHYRPSHQPLEAIEALAAAHGVGHLVLVQPSVYGCDNRVLLRALNAGQGRHRGVAVLDPRVTDAELDRLHAAGVRGVRINRVSPAGHAGDASADVRGLAPRLKERGWHVQWYVQASRLPALVPLQSETGLCFVLDHLGGLGAQVPPGDPAWAAAQALADAGAWIKLSAWYRLGDTAPYGALLPAIQRAATWFGTRTVWGSDWPHTSFAADQWPPYASTQEPVQVALGLRQWHALLNRHARALYR